MIKKIIYLAILLASSLHISCFFNIQNFVKKYALASSFFSLMGVGVNVFYHRNYNAKQNLIIAAGFAPLLFNCLFLRWNKFWNNIDEDIQNRNQFINNFQIYNQTFNSLQNQLNSLQNQLNYLNQGPA